MKELPTNFLDDILSAGNIKRKYRMTNNPDGTISLDDVTDYQQIGSRFGAKEINEINLAINEINKNRLKTLTEILENTKEGFSVDALAVKELANKNVEVIDDSLGRGSRIIKFQNGLMFQMEQIFFTCPTMNPYGSLYSGAYLIQTQRKVPFVENKLLLGYATAVYAGDLSIASSYAPNTKTIGRYDFFGHSNLQGKELGVNLISIGFWK